MKKLLLPLFLLALPFTTKAQEAVSLEETYGVQIGFLGIWGHAEGRLSNQVALRTEVGFDSALFGGNVYEGTGIVLTPSISVEPKWYYNLNKRVSKSRSITGNSGNFFSFKTKLNPDWFALSNYSNIEVLSQLSLIPSWGIRRNISQHFQYETGLGLGYRYIGDPSEGFSGRAGGLLFDLHLRVGYRF